jgi:hypothetical protein
MNGRLLAIIMPEMFKVQRSGEMVPPIFALSGHIEEKHVAELESLFDGTIDAPGATLDLKEVRLVDREAVRFLGDCEARGIKLENCRPYILEWIQARSFACPSRIKRKQKSGCGDGFAI